MVTAWPSANSFRGLTMNVGRLVAHVLQIGGCKLLEDLDPIMRRKVGQLEAGWEE